MKPWVVPEDEDLRKRGPPNISLTVCIGTKYDLEAEYGRVKTNLDEILQAKSLIARFDYKEIQEVVTAANTMAAGVHKDLDPRGTCEVFQGVIDTVHHNLIKSGDDMAKSTERMKLAVRVMNMPSWQHEKSDLLRKLPKRNADLNKAHFIEVAAKHMTFFKKCVKIAQKNGMFSKKLGPGVQLFFTGNYRDQEMLSRNEEAQAI